MAFYNKGGYKTRNDDYHIGRLSLDISCDDFVYIMTQNLYNRIYKDVLNRIDGIPTEYIETLYNNSNILYNTRYGLLHYLVEGITTQSNFYLVLTYNKLNNKYYLRKETYAGENFNKNDNNDNDVRSVLVSYKHYRQVELVNTYNHMLYENSTSVLNLSRMEGTPIYYFDGLRKTASKDNISEISKEGGSITKGLKENKSISLDGKDKVEFLNTKTDSLQKNQTMIEQNLASTLGLPVEYLGGLGTSKLIDTGESYERKLHSGLKTYYLEYVKGIIEELYNIKTEYVGTDKFKNEKLREELEIERLKLENKKLELEVNNNNNNIEVNNERSRKS